MVGENLSMAGLSPLLYVLERCIDLLHRTLYSSTQSHLAERAHRTGRYLRNAKQAQESEVSNYLLKILTHSWPMSVSCVQVRPRLNEDLNHCLSVSCLSVNCRESKSYKNDYVDVASFLL